MLKGVTLRGIEVFEALASSGSVAGAAERTGLSQPAVSQQLRNLEKAIGVALVDHSKRPMQLTHAGRGFQARAQTILRELNLAQNDLLTMDLSHLSTLSLGIIDDFDNGLTPRLVTILAENLCQSSFRLTTAPSHEINDLLNNKEVMIAISASPETRSPSVIEIPLIQDPFILAVPRGFLDGSSDPLERLRQLSFLRYDRDHMIGQRIDAELKRHNMSFESRFEIGSNPSVMAMVARGLGWAITTPLGLMRSQSAQDAIDAHPLPFAPFSRRISVFASTDWADTVPKQVALTAKQLAQREIIEPAVARFDWLKPSFTCLYDDER